MDYLVEVSTVFSLEEGTDDLIISCPAEYSYSPDEQQVRYDEFGEDGSCVHTRVLVTPHGADIERSGSGALGLKLRVGESQHGIYTLEFGSIEIEYVAESIENGLGEEGGTLHMIYSMSIGGIASRNSVRLTVSRVRR